MRNHNFDQDPLRLQLKHLVADMFRLDILEPDKIADHEPLIGGGLGLDSLDALEFAMCLEEEFGITIQCKEESHSVLASIASLADFIHTRARTSHGRQRSPAATRITHQMLTSPSLA